MLCLIYHFMETVFHIVTMVSFQVNLIQDKILTCDFSGAFDIAKDTVLSETLFPWLLWHHSLVLLYFWLWLFIFL